MPGAGTGVATRELRPPPVAADTVTGACTNYPFASTSTSWSCSKRCPMKSSSSQKRVSTAAPPAVRAWRRCHVSQGLHQMRTAYHRYVRY